MSEDPKEKLQKELKEFLNKADTALLYSNDTNGCMQKEVLQVQKIFLNNLLNSMVLTSDVEKLTELFDRNLKSVEALSMTVCTAVQQITILTSQVNKLIQIASNNIELENKIITVLTQHQQELEVLDKGDVIQAVIDLLKRQKKKLKHIPRASKDDYSNNEIPHTIGVFEIVDPKEESES